MEEQQTEKLNSNSDSAQAVDKPVDSVDNSKQNGGARPGAGRPKGSISPETKLKIAAKQRFESRVRKHAQELFNAQMSLARGVQLVVKRERVKTKKGWRWTPFETVTNEQEIIDFLDGNFDQTINEFYMITAEKPDPRAIDSLLDRAFGKAPQSLEIKDERPDPIEEILRKFGLLEEEGNSTDAGQDEGAEETTP
jgi:hypothetical protein